MNEREREQLQAELVAEREALLAVVSHIQQQALAWPSRNAGWSVRDVLAHVLASDSDLISLVEAAGRSRADFLGLRDREAHEREMARWTDATPQELAEELRQRGDRWRELLTALPGSAFATPAVVWWMGGTLGDAVASWRGHDRQHGEDLRLALAHGRTLVE